MQWDAAAGQEWQPGETEGMRIYTCNTCGGEIVGDETIGATECPFCGNPVVMTGQLVGDLPMDKGQLKSVRKQDRANVYVKPGSMQLTQSGDYFMYRNVTRTVKQSSSSSGSGSSRSSGGRSF